MPKTMNMPNIPQARAAATSGQRGQRWAIALFLLAYIAILGVLFAPKGYFIDGEPVAQME